MALLGICPYSIPNKVATSARPSGLMLKEAGDFFPARAAVAEAESA